MATPFLTASWRHLILLNWRVDDALLASRVPAGTRLDHHDGSAWISLVAFLFLDTRVKGVPIPFHVNFEEVNLRFYVGRDQPDEVRQAPYRRGVVFIRELVPRFAIAAVARWVYGENYESVPMDHRLLRGAEAIAAEGSLQVGDRVEYGWGEGESRVDLAGTVASEPALLAGNAHFLAEHYWGYARQGDGGTMEYEVVHPPWRALALEGVSLRGNAAAHYGPEFAEVLKRAPDEAFLAEGSEVKVLEGLRCF